MVKFQPEPKSGDWSWRMYEHQDGQAERVNFPLFNLFCPVQTVEGLDEAIHVGERYLLSSVYLVKCEFHLEPSS